MMVRGEGWGGVFFSLFLGAKMRAGEPLADTVDQQPLHFFHLFIFSFLPFLFLRLSRCSFQVMFMLLSAMPFSIGQVLRNTSSQQ